MTAVLMGYDVEACAIGEGLACIGAHTPHGMSEAVDRTSTRRGLEIIRRNHEEAGVPATLFICGRTLVHNLDAIEPFVDHPLFDLQQHTYSHSLLKGDDWKGASFKASPPEAIEQELLITADAFRRTLGIEVTGLRTPHGYYQGLTDAPEMLAVLDRCGIEFVSSWSRNEQGGNPTPLSVQPFYYAEQGYPDLLELPFQFWLDGTWFEQYGLDQGVEFGSALAGAVDEAIADDLVYGVCFHEWAMLRYAENETGWVKALLRHCAQRGVSVQSYREFFLQHKQGAAVQPG